MIPINGIGGLFIRAADPQALAAWYADVLGISNIGQGQGPWMQEAGPTVFSPFPEDSDYFATDRRWMLNLRVSDLDACLAALEERGIAVERRAEWDGDYGRFARIHDPDGNPIELWQPPEVSPS